YRFYAVFLKKRVGLMDAAWLKDARAFTIEQRFSHPAAGPITGVVTDHRAEEERQHNEPNIQLIGRRKKARNDKERIAGQAKPDGKAGLRKQNKPQAEINIPAKECEHPVDKVLRVENILDRVKQVEQ